MRYLIKSVFTGYFGIGALLLLIGILLHLRVMLLHPNIVLWRPIMH